MKFNEKLIDLRKKEGLSQEELGYKLGVTRQTISKWELSQTTPEMEKLVEIAKLFNVSVDELLNEEEIIKQEKSPVEEQVIDVDKSSNRDGRKKLVIVILIILIVLCLGLGVTQLVGNKEEKYDKNVFERFFSLFDSTTDIQQDAINNIGNMEDKFNDTSEKVDEMQQDIIQNIQDAENRFETTGYNNNFTIYSGNKRGTTVKEFLEEVIMVNTTNERKVIVKFNDKEIYDIEELRSLKDEVKDSKNYEIIFDYDTDGYIFKATITRKVTEYEISTFNASLEMYAGTKWGTHAISVIDRIITINKTEERKVTIVYKNKEIQDEKELKEIKKKIENFDDYEITCSYDEEGFINKVEIEKI